MKLTVLPTGETMYRYKKSITVQFNGRRRVLSTSVHNGGYREDLTAVFNNDGTVGAGMACELKAPTYSEHMALLAEELGLDPGRTAGLSTAAQMENVAVCTETFRDTAVTAVVTGGIEVNGGRIGDTATWYESAGKAVSTKLGTINIMVFINVDLSEGALARALVTCTEAKTAAIQELLAPSRYSMGLATGSGTDGTIIAANMDSGIQLTNAGKHSKLGEILGKAVKAAVKEALNRQSGLCPEGQHDVIRRMDRFGINEDSLWAQYRGTKSRAEFSTALETILKRGMIVTYSSLYAHLLDQLMWGLISADEAKEAGGAILELMAAGMDGGKSDGGEDGANKGAANKDSGDSMEEDKWLMPERMEDGQTSLPAGCAAEPAILSEMIEDYGKRLQGIIWKELG